MAFHAHLTRDPVALAQHLAANDKPAAAVDVLTQAAQAGDQGSALQHALWQAHGVNTDRDEHAAFETLSMLAGAGNPVARRLRATLAFTVLDTSDIEPVVQQDLVLLAQKGDADSLTSLGLLSLTSCGECQTATIPLLLAAAKSRSASAALALGLLTLRGQTHWTVEEARGWIMIAQSWGHGLARDHAAAHEGQPVLKPELPKMPLDWSQVQKTTFFWPHARSLPDLSPVSSAPFIAWRRRALSDYDGLYAIGLGGARLSRATVNDHHRGQIRDDSRTNQFANFYLTDNTPLAASLRCRLLNASAEKARNGDALSLLAYAPGEEYQAHHDYFQPEEPAHRRDLEQNGQRDYTILAYLNDSYDGGTTDFPRAGLSLRGGAGDILVFRNVKEDCQPDPLTLHAGRPPENGVKWVLSQWTRAQP